MTQVPLAPPPPTGGPVDGWLYLLWRRMTQAGQILWGTIDTSGSNLTDIETRNHNDLQTVQGGAAGDYYHQTQAQHDDTLAASYVAMSSSTSLPNTRTLVVSQGVTLVDGGAGSTVTVGLQAFVGDSGSGGLIGAVPAPVSGDGAAQRYLSADGIWRDPGTSGAIYHNNLLSLQGGIGTQVFESTAFETTAFKTDGTTEYYHVDSLTYNESVRVRSILSTAINATLDDDAATCVATVSGLTITLPNATAARTGREWTVQLSAVGTMVIVADASDTIMTPDGADTSVSVDGRATSLTFRCTSSSTWIIV